MEIRNTKAEELDEVMEIYAHARNFMAQTGNPNQWGRTNWPPREMIAQDIAEHKSYVCVEDGVIGAVFYFDHGCQIDPTYLEIDGAWIGDETYGVVHRIASSHLVKGAGRYAISWCFEKCGHLRMDTHEDNEVMQKVLESLGFVRCGIIYVHEDRDPRIAFEKIK